MVVLFVLQRGFDMLRDGLSEAVLFGAIGTWIIHYGKYAKLKPTMMMEHDRITDLNWSRAVDYGYFKREFIDGVTHHVLTRKALKFFDRGHF